MERWFLLETSPAPAAENMALDEMLLKRVKCEFSPIVRLYSFDPPGITIGRNQDPSRVLDMEAVQSEGLDVARRITGGGALLHAGEMTYCIVAKAGSPIFARGPREAFCLVSEALAAALGEFGIEADIRRNISPPAKGALSVSCLSSTARWELSVRGRKIAGNAQRMIAGAFLQHGSILLRPGSERITRYLRDKSSGEANLVTNVEEELGKQVSQEEFHRAMTRSFESIFGAPYERITLSLDERKELAQRARAKREEISILHRGTWR